MCVMLDGRKAPGWGGGLSLEYAYRGLQISESIGGAEYVQAADGGLDFRPANSFVMSR